MEDPPGLFRRIEPDCDFGPSKPGERRGSTGIEVDHYRLLRKLGEGSHGVVWAGFDAKYEKSGDASDTAGAHGGGLVGNWTGHATLPVAVKVIDRESLGPDEVEAVHREVRLLAACDHPNVVRLFEALEDSRRSYLVMEYLTGGDLHQQISKQGPLREAEACRLFGQLVDALVYCHHTMQVCHGDVKLENMLFDNLRSRNVKLVDFGLARPMVPSPRVYQHHGTPAYAAPEVIRVKGDDVGDGGYDGRMADVWSAGVVLFVMVCGFLPFEDKSFFRLAEKISDARPDYPAFLSAGAAELLGRMLVADPKKRATLEEVLSHPWFGEHGRHRLAAAAAAAAAAAGGDNADTDDDGGGGGGGGGAAGRSRRQAQQRRPSSGTGARSTPSAWYGPLLGPELDETHSVGSSSSSFFKSSPQIGPSYRPVDDRTAKGRDMPHLTLSNLPPRRRDITPLPAAGNPGRSWVATVDERASPTRALASPSPPQLPASLQSQKPAAGARVEDAEPEGDEGAEEAYGYLFGGG